MATITPHLRRGKAKGGRAPIYIRISHKGKECFVSLGLQAREKDWNAPRARLRKSYTGFFEANRRIEEVATRLEAIARAFVLSGEAFSAQDIKRHYLGQAARGDAESVDGGFLAFAWQRHGLIERCRPQRRRGNPARCSRANSSPDPSTLTPTPSARSSIWLPSATYRI